MTAVAVRGASKWYGSTQALDEVDLLVPEGSFTVILGPSGCGKSTLLRLIAGLEHPQAGSIEIGGRDVTEAPAADRGLGMVFQSYALFPHLSVQENIVFGLKMRGIQRDVREHRLQEVVELLGIGSQIAKRPGQLSGGERQRVAVARALVSGASLILMDEPLSNLDAKLRQQMRTELRDLQQKLQLTVVYVTHDQVEAMTMADQVVVMRTGSVEQAASPWEVYSAPATLQVATFVGAPPMSLVSLDCARSAIRVPPGTPHPVLGFGTAGGPDNDLLIGVRPEDLDAIHAGVTVHGTVRSTELLGSDKLVSLEVGSGAFLTARVRPDVPTPHGSELTLGVLRDKIHAFDVKTGNRVQRERVESTTQRLIATQAARDSLSPTR